MKNEGKRISGLYVFAPIFLPFPAGAGPRLRAGRMSLIEPDCA
jgi:hypothetical protein